jgi:hypothetical protein
MKKLISLCFLIVIVLTAKAQSESETLEWLRAKQPAISGKSLSIDSNSIGITSGEKTVKIQWSKIKDVTSKMLEITVVGDELVDGKNVFIRFSIDYKISDKYAKALRHMAELKGAKMVKDDLF